MTDGIKPSLTTSVVTRHMTSPLPPPQSAAEPGVRRRFSVSVAGPGDRRQRSATVSRSLSSSLPLPASPPIHYRHLPAADAAAQVDVKSHVSRNDLPTPATIRAIFDVSKHRSYFSLSKDPCHWTRRNK